MLASYPSLSSFSFWLLVVCDKQKNKDKNKTNTAGEGLGVGLKDQKSQDVVLM